MSNRQALSIRAFIGSKNYETSRDFYRELSFEEGIISPKMSLFTSSTVSFYLQDYYVKEWIENSMLLLEVEDVETYWNSLQKLELEKRYPGVRLIPIQENDWGKECLFVDPAGVLWHVAQFHS